jgi:DDE superfamily endonuclease
MDIQQDDDEEDIQQDDELEPELVVDHHVVAVNEMQYKGLRLRGYKKKKIKQAPDATNRQRFQSHYGISPWVCCTLYEDLQRTALVDAKIVNGNNITLKWFLIALNFLRKYPTEDEREATFDVSKPYGAQKQWEYVEKIQAMKAEKIVWDDSFYAEEEDWIITVDGTHCWINEPTHPIWSQDTSYYSHKFNKAGLNYELGIALSTSRLVWMNGPFPAGTNDISIFSNKGLEHKLQELQKKAIGDLGYSGHPGTISTPNAIDSYGVNLFKSRALKRHETFNGHTKVFECLNGRFRHSVQRFANCFEAVCVLCQYQIENDKPLFNILVEDVLEDH